TGWNLVGNAFPSAIDWESAFLTKTNLESGYYYVYNVDKSGGAGYEYYLDGSNKSDGVNGKIPAMQAFFVEAASGGGSLDIGNAARTHNDQAFLKNIVEEDGNLLKITLSGEAGFSTAQFRLRAESSEGKDYYDASMLFSLDESVPQIYSLLSTGKRFALNSLPVLEEELLIPLGLKLPDAGAFTFTAENPEFFNNEYAILLEDLVSGHTIDLRQDNSYEFAPAEPGFTESRFVLHLKSTVGIEEVVTSVTPTVYVSNRQLHILNGNGLGWHVGVTDITGRVIYNSVSYEDGVVDLPVTLKTGVYIVRIINDQQSYNQKVFIK
nr:T9SS type A sorting domain-containing protein [Bacteroidota bacterium]